MPPVRYPVPESDLPPARSPARFFLWLAVVFRGPVSLGITAGVVGMTARALIPTTLGLAVDRGVLPHDTGSLTAWAGAMFGLVLVQAAATVVQERCDFAAMMGTALRTLHLVNGHAARLGVTLRGQTGAGDVVSIGTGDIEPVGFALAATSRGAGGLVALVVIAAIMLSSAWQLGLVVLVGVPLILWLLAFALRPLRRRQDRVRTQQGRLTAVALDTISGLRVLHGFGGAERFAERYQEESQRTRWLATDAARVDGVLAAVKSLLPSALGVLVVWLGARMVLDHRLMAGQLVAFYGYTMFLSTPLRWVTDSAEALTRGYVSADRVCRFLRLERDLPEGAAPGSAPDAAPAELPVGPLVEPASGLELEPGVLTAVAYTSAVEAARLADRLGRYVESAATLGGVALRERPTAELRERILVVHNDDQLFRGTAAAGLDPAGRTGRDALLALADTACALDVVEALPGGLDGEIQPSGRNFSGGERQRLRLLRALAYAPSVLVLVEPTSALDALTETRLAGQLRSHRRGSTTVVFTTSPIVLDQADRVVLLDDATASARGTHAGLLATDPRYRSLVTREAELT